MPFGDMQEIGCVRISSLFPDPDRQDAGQGLNNPFRVLAMFSHEARLFCPNLFSNFLIARNAAQKRAALMSWENCGVERSNFVLSLFFLFGRSPNRRKAVQGLCYFYALTAFGIFAVYGVSSFLLASLKSMTCGT